MAELNRSGCWWHLNSSRALPPPSSLQLSDDRRGPLRRKIRQVHTIIFHNGDKNEIRRQFPVCSLPPLSPWWSPFGLRSPLRRPPFLRLPTLSVTRVGLAAALGQVSSATIPSPANGGGGSARPLRFLVTGTPNAGEVAITASSSSLQRRMIRRRYPTSWRVRSCWLMVPTSSLWTATMPS